MNFHNGEHFDFYVNEEKRTVVAVLTVPDDVVGCEMFDIINKASNSSFAITNGILGKGLMVTGRYEGKAVCHENDEWDVEKGKHIAKLRALRTYTKERAKKMASVERIFNEIAKRFEAANEYSQHAIEHIEDALDAE